MIAATVLLGHAVVLAVLGRRALAAAQWPQRRPGWGIVAWQALSVSVVLSGLLAGLALAVPMLPAPVAHVVDVSTLAVAEHYRTPGGPWVGLVGAAVALAVLGVVVARAATAIVRAASCRRRLRAALTTLGRPHPDGYTLLEHPSPLVYCVPGRRPAVVVTRGAHEALSPAELGVVLAHERRHLRARHDLAIAASGALAATLPLPVLTEAHRRIGALAEMSADDAARAGHDRRLLAGALVVLGGDDAVERVTRLLEPAARRRPAAGVLAAVAATLAVAVPVGLSIAPAVEAAATRCCDEAAP